MIVTKIKYPDLTDVLGLVGMSEPTYVDTIIEYEKDYKIRGIGYVKLVIDILIFQGNEQFEIKGVSDADLEDCAEDFSSYPDHLTMEEKVELYFKNYSYKAEKVTL